MHNKIFKILALQIFLVACLHGCNSKNKDVLILPDELEVINTSVNKLMEDELKKRVKVVAIFYSEHTRVIDLPRYNEYINKYPEVGFVFYVDHDDKSELRNYLNEIDIKVPVYYDPNQEFIRSNKSRFRSKMTFIGYIVNFKNEILGLTNPSLPDFEKKLKSAL